MESELNNARYKNILIKRIELLYVSAPSQVLNIIFSNVNNIPKTVKPSTTIISCIL